MVAGMIIGLWSIADINVILGWTEDPDSFIAKFGRQYVEIFSGPTHDVPERLIRLLEASVLMCAVIWLLLIGPIQLAFRARSGRWSRVPGSRICALARRYALVSQAASAISACASANRATRERVPEALLAVSRELEAFSDLVLRSQRMRGMVSRRSHRVAKLQNHAGLVVAALRKAEEGLDRDSRDATLTHLAEMLLQIADRHAQGRVGQLLDEGHLENLEPVKNRETIRIVATTTIVAATLIGANLIGLPDAVIGYLVPAVIVIATITVYGRRASLALNHWGPNANGGG